MSNEAYAVFYQELADCTDTGCSCNILSGVYFTKEEALHAAFKEESAGPCTTSVGKFVIGKEYKEIESVKQVDEDMLLADWEAKYD